MRPSASVASSAFRSSSRITRCRTVPTSAARRETLAFIRESMKRQQVCLDCYPYTAGSTMIRTDRGMLDGRVLIASSVPHPECAGRDLGDIAKEWGVAESEAARRMQPGTAIYFLMDEPDVQRILAFDETMIGSDGIPLGEKPHPRLWGTFPRVLGHYSRDVGLFPLETAVWKMSGLTARNFGLAGRGMVAVGQHADLVLFDAATVRDAATYDEPTRAAEGIHAVIVNGAVAWEDGRSTGTRRGRVLKRTPSRKRRQPRGEPRYVARLLPVIRLPPSSVGNTSQQPGEANLEQAQLDPSDVAGHGRCVRPRHRRRDDEHRPGEGCGRRAARAGTASASA